MPGIRKDFFSCVKFQFQLLLDALRSGGGRIGKRSCDLSFFCTSISRTSKLGLDALTGTQPDSAPQTPLNVSGLSLAARIRSNVASGVPMRSTPRTNSSDLPSAYTR